MSFIGVALQPHGLIRPISAIRVLYTSLRDYLYSAVFTLLINRMCG